MTHERIAELRRASQEGLIEPGIEEPLDAIEELHVALTAASERETALRAENERLKEVMRSVNEDITAGLSLLALIGTTEPTP